ncbi:hypothetical protein V2J09_003418 [Rumex salicifolius]
MGYSIRQKIDVVFEEGCFPFKLEITLSIASFGPKDTLSIPCVNPAHDALESPITETKSSINSDRDSTAIIPSFSPHLDSVVLPTNLDDASLILLRFGNSKVRFWDNYQPEEIYRRLIGRLLYLNITSPDTSFFNQHLSQLLCCPREPHLQAILYVVKYLKGTLNLGLFYSLRDL